MAESRDPFNNVSGLVVSDTSTKNTSVEYSTAYDPNLKINSIIESMNVYDRNHINTQIMREKLANKLMNAAMTANLDEGDPEALDVNLHIMMEARSILNDLDKAAKDNVAVKLKKKDTENAEAFNMAEFLSKIKIADISQMDSGTIVVQSPSDIGAELDRLEKERGVVILDTELEEGNNMLPAKPENEDD